MNVLTITEQQVASLISIEDVLEVVELALREYAHGYVQMPPKVYLTFRENNGDLRTMPAFLERLNISAAKVANVHPDNPKKYGIPTVMVTLLLVEPKTGQLLSMMGAGTITALRTGAAGGAAAKYLAVKNPKVASFVGAGTQARSQLAALQLVFPGLREVRVWDIKPEAAVKFKKEVKGRNGELRALPVAAAQEAAENADIVVTTTPSTKPVVLNAWVTAGTHFNCIGADAPGKEEMDPAILKRSKIVVDDWAQASHSGEINVPVSSGILRRENVWAELGEIMARMKIGRSSPNEMTVFDSTGLAIHDAITAELVYRRALEKKVGSYVSL